METISDYRTICEKMDKLSAEEKEKSISFGLAVGALEGVEVSEETKNEIRACMRERKPLSRCFKIRFQDMDFR